MTLSEALAYQSTTTLGQNITACQQIYGQASAAGVPQGILAPLGTLLVNLATLDQQLIAYDAQVADFQARCTAITRANGTAPGPNPIVIGLGSATVGGILGFVAARMTQKKPDGENPDGAEEET